MKPFLSMFLTGAVLSAALYAVAGAQSQTSYTTAQASTGSTVYMQHCSMCHGADLQGVYAPALNGPNGKVQMMTVSAVYTYTKTVMPSGNAGTLSQSQYVDLMAYLMQRHGLKAGSTPLTNASATADQQLLGGDK